MKLYTKISLWLCLNLVILALALYVVFRLQFHVNLDSLLLSRAGERLQAVSEIITSELSATPEPRWNEVLKRFSQAYKVEFTLFRADGTQAAGEPLTLPPAVMDKVTEFRNPFGMGRGPPPGKGRMRQAAETAWLESRPKFLVHTTEPSRYWAGACLNLADNDRRLPRLVLLAQSSFLHGSGLFLDLTPWIAAAFAAVLLSVLLWLPLVRGITRAISQITRTTEQIAEGRFDARVRLRRRDELGRLGQAINQMTDRLAGFVTGQKRFLGDVAHELCSPLARMEVALGILERQASEPQKATVADMREEVREMSQLVNELLSFSKAALQAREIILAPVSLADFAAGVVADEAAGAAIQVDIAPGLQVLAAPDLLRRALANLVRNAVRYAGDAGPISVTATADGDRVTLTVADSGPGVPPAALQQIFEPFYRVDDSRSRDSGGVGLGLAIVKTCVEACQGTVTAQNRQPAGLEVTLTLKTAGGKL